MLNLLFYPLQTENEGTGLLCTYIIILGLIFLGLYVGLYVFNRYFADKSPKQHPCKYCGHIVNSVSECCHAPVREKFGGGKCMKCGKETRIICIKCKRSLH